MPTSFGCPSPTICFTNSNSPYPNGRSIRCGHLCFIETDLVPVVHLLPKNFTLVVSLMKHDRLFQNKNTLDGLHSSINHYKMERIKGNFPFPNLAL